MTAEERQQIVADVISAISTNSAQIMDLTEVQNIPEGSFIELSGGKRISLTTLKSLLQTFIIDSAVEPTLSNERTARQQADSDEATARQQAISAINTIVTALQDAFDNEESVRQQAISNLESITASLQQAINTEAAARGTADSNETSARQSADAQMVAAIQEEAEARRQADEDEAAEREAQYSILNNLATTLIQAHDAETAARQQAVDDMSSLVSALQQAINNEATIRNTADSEEAAARQQAISNLSSTVSELLQLVNSREEGYSDLIALCQSKLDKSSVVEATGNSSENVMSQKFVTQQLEAIRTRIGRIDVSKGSPKLNSVQLEFTDENGITKAISIPGASLVSAGVMTVADKAALDNAVSDIGNLQDERITGVSCEADDDSVSIELGTGGGSGHGVTIPNAGTIPTGETDPVAGVMSAQQAQDLADVLLEVFPLVVTVTSSNAGVYEKGQTVTPAVTLSVTRRGTNVVSEAIITTPMTVNGGILSYEAITENTSFNISVAHMGSTVAVPQQQYRFVNYVYGNVISAVPDDIVEAIAASSTLRELSTRTTYSGTLAKDKMFLFAVPGNVTLLCKHSETGANISGCITGTAMVPRLCDAGTTDLYSYIIVPSADVAWNFKITNS